MPLKRGLSLLAISILIVIGSSRYSSTANVQSPERSTRGGPMHRSMSRILNEIRGSRGHHEQRDSQDEMSNDIHMLPSNTLNQDAGEQSQRYQNVQRASRIRSRTSIRPKATLAPSVPTVLVEKWTLEVKGGPKEADRIAELQNCNNLGLVKGFNDIYLFEKKKDLTPNGEEESFQRAKRDFQQTEDRLLSHPSVVWVEPQTSLTRVKRSVIDLAAAHRLSGHLYQQRFAPVEQPFPSPNYPISTAQPQHPYQIAASVNFGQQQLQQQQQQPQQFTYSQYLHQQQQQQPKPHQQQQQHQQQQAHYWGTSTTFKPNEMLVGGYNQPQQSQQQYMPSSERKMSNGPILAPSTTSTSTTKYPAINKLPPTHSATGEYSQTGSVINSPLSGQSSPNSTKFSQESASKQIANHNIGGDVRDVFSRGYSPSASNEDRNKYDDELWMHQWYLQDNSNNAHIQSGMHLHVQDVWKMGFTGKNVVVSVIDDGLEWNHTDLISNYDPRASYDMNNNDSDPFPRYDVFETNSHGTRCAGEIAMVSNNKKCGVGVAPDAKIGGIKSLDGDVSDHIESMSLLHNLDYIDIYSGSWGPKDDGVTLEGPKRLAAQALENGVSHGRKGRGAIYVWANGNGGVSGDNCNCDGYVSSLFTLAVGSVTQKGQFPFYGERCSSTLAVTCSSGTYSDKKITTTDLHNKCTTDYSGTSAAAPLAAGILALVLEANPNITWRDAQHLVAWTSEYYPLKDNTGWFRNSAGLLFNNKFGFGLMNAKSLVEAALTWKSVPQKSVCVKYATEYSLPDILMTGTEVEVPFYTDGCELRYRDMVNEKLAKGKDASTWNRDSYLYSVDRRYEPQPVNYLEHVQVFVTIEYPVRGDIDIFLTSPSGTTSNILTYRPLDRSMLGFTDWPFMSVHFWGERPRGTWLLRVRDKNRGQPKTARGYLVNATLILHGTTTKPDHMLRPRIYDGEDQIKYTLEKSVTSMSKNGFMTYDENPWDQNNYPNDMSPVAGDMDEDRLVTARMVDSGNIAISNFD